MLGQDIAAKAVFNVDGESPKHMYLLISQHELLPLLLERKQLLDNIQMNRNACAERHTEQQEHHPYLVLNTELIPPLCDPSVHRAASSLLSTCLGSCDDLNLGFRRNECQDWVPKTKN